MLFIGSQVLRIGTHYLCFFFSISEKDLQIKKKKTHGSIDLPENSGIWSRWLS